METSLAEQVLALALSRPATLGAGRLICIDGPSGSGKTSLAAQLAALALADVVHMDDLYDGWDGLPDVQWALDRLLRPLSRGVPGSYCTFDWHLGAFTGATQVTPGPLLIVEGVGSAPDRVADLVTVTVWLDAPVEVRRRRGIERDGEAFAEQWDRWAAAERGYFATQATQRRADLPFVSR